MGELREVVAEGGQKFEIDRGGCVEGVDVEKTGLGDEGERECEFWEMKSGAFRSSEAEVLEAKSSVLE